MWFLRNFGQERTNLNWHGVQGGAEKGLQWGTHNSYFKVVLSCIFEGGMHERLAEWIQEVKLVRFAALVPYVPYVPYRTVRDNTELFGHLAKNRPRNTKAQYGSASHDANKFELRDRQNIGLMEYQFYGIWAKVQNNYFIAFKGQILLTRYFIESEPI